MIENYHMPLISAFDMKHKYYYEQVLKREPINNCKQR